MYFRSLGKKIKIWTSHDSFFTVQEETGKTLTSDSAHSKTDGKHRIYLCTDYTEKLLRLYGLN